MGEKTQSGVTDLHKYKFDPLPQDTEAGQTKSTPPRKRGRHKRLKNADIIPAFLPERKFGDLDRDEKTEQHWADSLSQAVSDETPDDDILEDESVTIRIDDDLSDTPNDMVIAFENRDDRGDKNGDPEEEDADEFEPPLAAEHSEAEHSGDGAETGESINDPELIGLLEQLSATIDNANQVLSETPGLDNGATADVDDLMAEPETAHLLAESETSHRMAEPEVSHLLAEPEAPQAWQQQTSAFQAPRRNRMLLPMLLTGIVLFGSGAGFWWYSSSSSDLATGKTETRLVSNQENVALKVPVPAAAVPVPLPTRKPVSIVSTAEASTTPTDSVNVASLSEPSFFQNPDTLPGESISIDSPTVTPAPSAAPVSINEPPADDEVAAISEALTTPSATAPAPVQAAKPSVLRGYAGEPIALGLTAPQRQPGSVEVSVMIQGVPKGATLSSGSRIGGGTWILDDSELDNLALLTNKKFTPNEFELGVSFVKSDGKVPDSRSIKVAVEQAGGPATNALSVPSPVDSSPAIIFTPGTAPGPTAPASTVPRQRTQKAALEPQPTVQPAAPGSEESILLERGKELLDLGDVSGARLILEHAARRGSKNAMILLGNTYDPEHLNKLGVQGVQSDPDQALVWYERASRKADR